MKKRTKWILTSLILLAAMAGGMYNIMKKTPASEEPDPTANLQGRSVLHVNAQIVKEELLTDGIFVTGSLLPDEEVDLSFETSGKIVQINFEEGSVVKKGDLLAKVNDEVLVAQLAKYEVQVKLAEDRVFRQNALLAKDAVSQEAYEQAQTDLATLKAEIELVKANIRLTELRAPFDGIIGLRNISEGAYASPSVVVATLSKISPLKIDFAVPERYASQIRKGTGLSFSIEGDLREFDARVYAVEGKVDIDSRQLPVRALYPNTDGRLLPGRYVGIRIKMDEIPNAITIPAEALVPEMGIDKVFLYKNGKAQPVEIKKGIRTEAKVHVISGLNVGDTLIVSGTLQLRTGLDVKLDQID